jgi:hypothetical protein
MPLDRIKDLDMLRWDDQARIRDLVHAAPLPPRPRRPSTRSGRKRTPSPTAFKPADMETLLRRERLSSRREEAQRRLLVHKVADGLLNGLAGPCPSCHSVASLRWTGIEFICRGWQTEYVRCDWRGPGTVAPNLVQRFVFQIPKALKDSHKFLKKWSPARWLSDRRLFWKGCTGLCVFGWWRLVGWWWWFGADGRCGRGGVG